MPHYSTVRPDDRSLITDLRVPRYICQLQDTRIPVGLIITALRISPNVLQQWAAIRFHEFPAAEFYPQLCWNTHDLGMAKPSFNVNLFTRLHIASVPPLHFSDERYLFRDPGGHDTHAQSVRCRRRRSALSCSRQSLNRSYLVPSFGSSPRPCCAQYLQSIFLHRKGYILRSERAVGVSHVLSKMFSVYVEAVRKHINIDNRNLTFFRIFRSVSAC